MEQDHGKLDIQAYEDRLGKLGICPYMSVGMSQVPCTDKCALYIVREEDGVSQEVRFKGCSHKLQAESLDDLRFYEAEKYRDD